jgi:RimJ/RimL family protein N-acetyltransferase
LDDDLARDLIQLSAASDHHEVLAVLRNGEIVGQVRMLFETSAVPQAAEFSYWFGQAYWGKGLGSAIVAIHSGRTFVQHPALGSIFAVVHPDNAASQQVLRKAGYIEEGPDNRRPGWIRYRLTRARAGLFSSGGEI